MEGQGAKFGKDQEIVSQTKPLQAINRDLKNSQKNKRREKKEKKSGKNLERVRAVPSLYLPQQPQQEVSPQLTNTGFWSKIPLLPLSLIHI